MKFAHLADVHIGSWRDPRLRDVSTECFCEAMKMCVAEQVDFILISGDLFNTSMPSIEHLRSVVVELKKVHTAGIPVYYIAGSHDYSTSGKTMLDVIAAAGLAVNVSKGEEIEGRLKLRFFDQNGVKITGMIGKKGGLETAYYENLDYLSLEEEAGPKIFLFHSAITEMKPAHLEHMPSAPLSSLPKGFDYYAGGHVHVVAEESFPDHKKVVMPGPLFPCSFPELEKLKSGGFYIVESTMSEARWEQDGRPSCDWQMRYVPLYQYQIRNHTFDCEGKSPAEVEEMVIEETLKFPLSRCIVTLRLKGKLQGGRPSDINYREITRKCYECGAKAVLKNTYQLTSAEMESVTVEMGSAEDVESKLIDENIGQQTMFDKETEKKMIQDLMKALSAEKEEGETVSGFEKRVIEDVDVLFTD